MYSQIFLTAWLREISGTPRNFLIARETGIGFRMPLCFGFAAVDDGDDITAGAAAEAFVPALAATAALAAAAARGLQPPKTLDIDPPLLFLSLRILECDLGGGSGWVG